MPTAESAISLARCHLGVCAAKWPWFGELAERGYLIAGVHRGKNLLVTGEVADLLDPICRAEITRMRAADPGWRRLLDHLAEAGPASIDDIRVELRLKRQELNALRAPLERCGAIIARSLQVTSGKGHMHSSELIRWDQGHPPLAATSPIRTGPWPADRRWGPRGCCGARAGAAPVVFLAVVLGGGLVDGLVGDGRLRRVDGHVTTAR